MQPVASMCLVDPLLSQYVETFLFLCFKVLSVGLFTLKGIRSDRVIKISDLQMKT